MGENGAAYFIIENGTKSDDTLLSVISNIADATEVHTSISESNGVMSMNMQEMERFQPKAKQSSKQADCM